MAFVFRQDRDTNIGNLTKGTELGPGQYIEVQTAKEGAEGQAPFNSNTFRRVDNLKEDVPGPGSYFKAKDDTMIRYANRRLKGNDPIYKTFEYEQIGSVESWGIVLQEDLKEKKGFLSQERRFKLGPPPEEVTPGPGYYAGIKKNKLKAQKIRSKSISKHNAKVKVPSIPDQTKQSGYHLKEDNEGRVYVEPVVEEEPFKGEVGPFSYSVVKDSQWHKKGTAWSKMRSTKGMKMGKEEVQEEENIYEDSEAFKTRKEKALKELAVYHKNNREKRKKILQNVRRPEEVDPLAAYSKEQPGPGYYFINNENAGFKVRRVKESLQILGTNDKRFPENKTNPNIGPGSYFQAKPASMREANKNKFKPTQKIFKDNRSSDASTVFSDTPGPGQYDPTPLDKRQAQGNKNVIFGTSEKRFVNSQATKKLENPGPGSYLKQGAWNKSKRQFRRHPKPTKGYPMELIKNEIQGEKFEVPAVGTYNPSIVSDIQGKIHKKVNKFSMVKAPFDSLVKRFGKNNKDANLGPGYYHKEKVDKKVRENVPFNSQSGRFDENGREIIGPGKYNHSSYFDWNKKTFNVLYL